MHAAVAVRRVLAEADVGEQDELREARPRTARSARWTIPSSSQAPEPSSSFASGMPKRSTRLDRRAPRARPPRATRSSTEKRLIPGSALVRSRSTAPTKSGITKSSRSSRVSRTSARRASVRRRRRSRVAGKALTAEGYVRRTVRSRVRPGAFVSYGRDRAWLVGGFGRVGYGAAHGFGPETGTRCARVLPETGDRRELERLRARRRRPERHATRFLVIAFLSAVLLLTLLLTAFGTWTSTPVAARPMRFAERAPGRPADPADHRHGRRAADPASGRPERASRRSAITTPATARSRSTRVGRQGNEGLLARLWHKLAGGGREPRLVPAPRRPRPGHVGARRRRCARHRRLLAGQRHGRRHHRLRPRRAGRTARASTSGRNRRRRSSSRSRTCAPTRRSTVGSAVAKAARRSAVVVDLPASSGRRSPATRRTRATTCSLSVAPGRGAARFAERSSSSGTSSARPDGGRSRNGCVRCASELGAAFCIVNGENAADGVGITAKLAERILAAGADVITLGNRTWRRSEISAYLDGLGDA